MKTKDKLTSVDKKLTDLGFIKDPTSSNLWIGYTRKNEKYNYIHSLDFCHKQNGNHVVQSYQKDVNSDKFNNCVGLNKQELKLAYKKMKELGW